MLLTIPASSLSGPEHLIEIFAQYSSKMSTMFLLQNLWRYLYWLTPDHKTPLFSLPTSLPSSFWPALLADGWSGGRSRWSWWCWPAWLPEQASCTVWKDLWPLLPFRSQNERLCWCYCCSRTRTCTGCRLARTSQRSAGQCGISLGGTFQGRISAALSKPLRRVCDDATRVSWSVLGA